MSRRARPEQGPASPGPGAAAARRRKQAFGLVLCGLCLLALALRLYGITWGLPHPGRYYPFHPDESVLLNVVMNLGPFRGDFLPGFYNYGTGYPLLCRFFIDFAAGYGLADPRFRPMEQWVHDFARLLLISRLVAVALAVGTVALVVLTARRLYGRRAGWIAGLFLAVAPMHVVLAHYMAVDVPATFFVALCLFLCARALPGRAGGGSGAGGQGGKGAGAVTSVARGGRRRATGGESVRSRVWLGIGLAAGVAAGVKYNAGVVLLCGLVPLAACLRGRREAGDLPSAEPLGYQVRTSLKGAAGRDLQGQPQPASAGFVSCSHGVQPVADPASTPTHPLTHTRPLIPFLAATALLATGAAAGLILSTPGILLEPDAFQRDFLFELRHTQRGHGEIFRYLPAAPVYHATVSLPVALGWPLFLLSLGGIILAGGRRRPADVLMLAAVLPYYALLASADLRFLRYVAPLLPPLCILASGLVVGLAAWGRRRAGRRRRHADTDAESSGRSGAPPGRGGLFAAGSGAESQPRPGGAAEVPRIRHGYQLARGGNEGVPAKRVDEGGAPACFLAALAAAVAAASSLAHVELMAGRDPREAAAEWLRQTTRPGELVALATDPWFYTPPIHPSAGCVKVAWPYGGPPVWDPPPGDNPRPGVPDKLLAPFSLGEFRVLVPEGFPDPAGPLPVGDLERQRPDRVVISDYEYADPLRIGARDPRYAAENVTIRLWSALQRDYRLERAFRARPRFLGWEWFGRSTPPHDWAYTMPTIQVYRRRG